MLSPRNTIPDLLEVMASDAPESARAAARERLARIVDGACRGLVDIGAGGNLPAPGTDRLLRSTSPARAIALRYSMLGVPQRLDTPADPNAILLGRTLLERMNDQLDAIATDAGRVEAALLCRDLDDRSAGRLAARLGGERSGVRALGTFAPRPATELLRYSCRRLTSFGCSLAGPALVIGLGRSLLADVIAWSEPDVAAALYKRFAPGDVTRHAVAVAWAEPITRLVERRDT